MNEILVNQLFDLIKSSSTDLAHDIEDALVDAMEKEPPGSTSANTFHAILKNIEMAREMKTPICQDTGSLIFYVYHPKGMDTAEFQSNIKAAAEKATQSFLLRPNAVDPVTGKNTGNNVGINAPYVSFEQWDKDEIHIKLMQKGGGSENVSAQYKLPESKFSAGRDLKGVKKCVIDAIYQAQGKGCAPGVVAVGIGGDRASSYLAAKKQFFRKLGSENPDPELASLERELHQDLNKLGIGPMGFGGKTTVLGVFAVKQHRHPATYYVSVSYMCWACRRKTMTIKNGEAIYD
jgi:fumarate hydratase class I